MRRRPFPYWHWSGRTERPGGRKPTCPLDTDRASVARTVGFSRGYLGMGFVPTLELHTTVARIRTRLGAREGGGLAGESEDQRGEADRAACFSHPCLSIAPRSRFAPSDLALTSRKFAYDSGRRGASLTAPLLPGPTYCRLSQSCCPRAGAHEGLRDRPASQRDCRYGHRVHPLVTAIWPETGCIRPIARRWGTGLPGRASGGATGSGATSE